MQLKGLDCQSEIGFLSLFEYYKSCTVSLCTRGYSLLVLYSVGWWFVLDIVACKCNICDRAYKQWACGYKLTLHHITGHFSVLEQNICMFNIGGKFHGLSWSATIEQWSNFICSHALFLQAQSHMLLIHICPELRYIWLSV